MKQIISSPSHTMMNRYLPMGVSILSISSSSSKGSANDITSEGFAFMLAGSTAQRLEDLIITRYFSTYLIARMELHLSRRNGVVDVFVVRLAIRYKLLGRFPVGNSVAYAAAWLKRLRPDMSLAISLKVQLEPMILDLLDAGRSFPGCRIVPA